MGIKLIFLAMLDFVIRGFVLGNFLSNVICNVEKGKWESKRSVFWTVKVKEPSILLVSSFHQHGIH
jgi:hypothetical protein